MICCYQIGLGGIVSIAKSFVFRAELPMASGLSSDPSISRGGALSRRRDLVFVVNPRGFYLFNIFSLRYLSCLVVIANTKLLLFA